MNLFEADYAGRPCTVREVTQPEGEEVNTNDGLVHARKGDYVALDLVRAPRGYRGQHIEAIIRAKDNRLVLGNAIETEEEVTDDTSLEELDDRDLPPAVSDTPTAAKKAAPAKK